MSTHLAMWEMTCASHCAEWFFWTKAGPCNVVFSLCWQLGGNSEFMMGPGRIHLRLVFPEASINAVRSRRTPRDLRKP